MGVAKQLRLNLFNGHYKPAVASCQSVSGAFMVRCFLPGLSPWGGETRLSLSGARYNKYHPLPIT